MGYAHSREVITRSTRNPQKKGLNFSPFFLFLIVKVNF